MDKNTGWFSCLKNNKLHFRNFVNHARNVCKHKTVIWIVIISRLQHFLNLLVWHREMRSSYSYTHQIRNHIWVVFYGNCNGKHCVLAFRLQYILDNLCFFLILQSIQWWRPVHLSYVKLSYEQRVFKRHLGKGYLPEAILMLKWIPVVEQIEVEVVWPQELIYTKGG